MAELARNSSYDKLRTIGIVLVVLGHTLGISLEVELYIYSFHMPLFFFISGLVLTPTRLSQSWASAARHYGRRLLVPYFLFSIITYIPWVLVTRHYGADAALGIEAWQPLIGTLYGIGVGGWLQHNAMLWFFPCLFVLHFVYRMIRTRIRTGLAQYMAIAIAIY
jgi:acyltransferase